MGDEQTPQSDLIDDAIRQAEQQLEAKLEALRMSALGEMTPTAGSSDDVAMLRPTSPTPTEPAPVPAAPAAADGSWTEADGDDLTFRPTTPVADLTDVFVPDFDASDLDTVDEPVAAVDAFPVSESDHEPVAEVPSTSSVTDLVASWEPDAEDDDLPAFLTEPRADTRTPVQPNAWETPEPPAPVSLAPSEDEMQFWAHTRTALRNLQQVTEAMPAQVREDVVSEMDRLVREEAAITSNAIRLVQQQVQQGLPKLGDRVERAIEQNVAGSTGSIRQLRDELPGQLDRTAQQTRSAVRDDLDQTAATLHGAVQNDVAQLEQSIATNVTRLAQGVTDSVGRTERDIEALGESMVRFERGVHGEFDRVEAQLRSSIEGIGQSLHEALTEPNESIRKLEEELPTRFTSLEQTLLDQMQGTQRELTTAMSGLVEANRATLDRIASVASTLDEERTRRTEDVEMVVDTVTTGWEGLAGAIKALYAQGEENSRRIAEVEANIGNIRQLEADVQATMHQFQQHVANLTPAPVVVTVAHPDAEVRNSARGGWVPDTRS